MNKLTNIRHWPERMSPANFSMSRANVGMQAAINPRRDVTAQGAPPIPAPQVPDGPIHYSFNIPFASDLAGPNTEEILHATTDAVLRWTHPEEAPDDVPVHELPVHANNLAQLRQLCRDITSNPLPIEAHVISTTPKHVRGQVTTVILSGMPDVVYQTRDTILNQTPLSLRCTTVVVDGHLVANLSEGVLKKSVTDFLDHTSVYCGVDIFLLGPKLTPLVGGLNGDVELRRDQRWRVAIYGDILSSEHAKTRVLIHIDQLLGRVVDAVKFDTSLQQVLCGRNRKNIKLIESVTNTAIYFPPPFSQCYRYCPPNAQRRDAAEILITGETPQAIEQAKIRIHDILTRIRIFAKDVTISPAKVDSILLSRMDKVRKIIESNGTFIMFPPLGSRQGPVRVQALENLHVERSIRELMALVGQFYTASWIFMQPDTRQPSNHDIRTMLGDICANSDADVIFDRQSFHITGSDESVKAALMVISQIKFAVHPPYQIRVRIELANEHKEFVSGKKNGKINKIMGQSSVQIMFDTFGEYNFNIEVIGQTYDSLKQGLTLVEQEMPASISFHVPDQYHKRIIGIGGQHIQRIMKKHSVFVKFSNAMDRGGIGREDDDSRVDNVICRTPARNAQNLELVKSEILEMVDRVDSEFTSQVVSVDRLYHRQLLTRLSEIEELERTWNCKIVFPSTEQASDEVTVTGPQWLVPKFIDEFLGMVPDKHEVVMERSSPLIKFLESPDFAQSIVPKLKTQYEVEVTVHENPDERTENDTPTVTLLWTFTRNNAGGLRDAMDFLQTQLATAGVEPEIIKGSIPRPKSDTFEDSLLYFNSKLLQHVPAPLTTDSPTKPSFGDEVARERSNILACLRKPGSMSSISSFLDRRKNSSQSAANFFKGSSNVSKSSLISIESTRSFNADRNPWNDSGINLPDDDNNPWSTGHTYGNGVDKLAVPQPGDATPRHHARQSADSGRPSTSHSTNSGYPGPLPGPFR
ncbi:KH RNA-binding domain-containing protein [Canariomyces notabilis]|uniref:KH RNA-binding domain-containing protein n=1 Tax=Canariomyces notabilis TaxID=2074819 RepID=A0AAN6TD24_9PEZI|nr:KH RNA-binding domain-containing protein [Canariomyces arenarius]